MCIRDSRYGGQNAGARDDQAGLQQALVLRRHRGVFLHHPHHPPGHHPDSVLRLLRRVRGQDVLRGLSAGHPHDDLSAGPNLMLLKTSHLLYLVLIS